MRVLLSPEDFVELIPAIGGNIDIDYFIPSIRVAQEIKVKPLLTKTLYKKVETDFIAGTLAGDYLELYEDYVKYLIAYGSAEHLMTILPYKVGNAGVLKTSTDYGTPAEKAEVDFIVQGYRNIYEHFATETVKYLQETKFAEYPSNIKPNNGLVGGWYISDSAERIKNRSLPRNRYAVGSSLGSLDKCNDC
jgi:hypothetical protein